MPNLGLPLVTRPTGISLSSPHERPIYERQQGLLQGQRLQSATSQRTSGNRCQCARSRARAVSAAIGRFDRTPITDDLNVRSRAGQAEAATCALRAQAVCRPIVWHIHARSTGQGQASRVPPSGYSLQRHRSGCLASSLTRGAFLTSSRHCICGRRHRAAAAAAAASWRIDLHAREEEVLDATCAARIGDR